jgi:hypothetical protein
MMLRTMSGPKRKAGEYFTARSFMICRLLFKLLRSILGAGEGEDGRVTWYAREIRGLKVLVGKPCREENI